MRRRMKTQDGENQTYVVWVSAFLWRLFKETFDEHTVEANQNNIEGHDLVYKHWIYLSLHDIQIYSYTKAPPSSPSPRPFCKLLTINGSSNIINICRIFHQRPYCKLVTFYHQVIIEQKYLFPLPILPELPFATFANRPPVAVNSNSKETKIWNLSARRFASTAAFPPPSF